MGNAEGVQPGHGRLPAQFHDLELPHNGIPVRSLVEPQEAIGDREYGIVADLTLDIFPDEKSGCLPTGQEQRQPLNEGLAVPIRLSR